MLKVKAEKQDSEVLSIICHIHHYSACYYRNNKIHWLLYVSAFIAFKFNFIFAFKSCLQYIKIAKIDIDI